MGLARGRSNAQIGTDLGTSAGTVKTYLHRLYVATGAVCAAHLVRLGYDDGLLLALDPEPDPGTGLTARQELILGLLADGRTYQQIAARQHVSVNTIKGSIRRVYRNVGVTTPFHTRSAAQAVALGYQHGHLPLPAPAAAA